MGWHLKTTQYLSSWLNTLALDLDELDFYWCLIVRWVWNFGQVIYSLYLSFLNSNVGSLMQVHTLVTVHLPTSVLWDELSSNCSDIWISKEAKLFSTMLKINFKTTVLSTSQKFNTDKTH